MRTLIHWFLSGLAIVITAYLLPGVTLNSFGAALLTALVLGVINALIRPILVLLTLPINILTLGLFTFVINAIMIQIASAIVPGFSVANFGWALLFSLVLSAVTYVFFSFEIKEKKRGE